MKPDIDPRNVKGHYEIYVNGNFECSCDAGELHETLEELEQFYSNGYN